MEREAQHRVMGLRAPFDGPEDAPELLSVPQAARRAGVGVRQLRQAAKRGELPVYQVGAWPRVRWAEVIRWICAQRVSPTSHAKRRVAEVLEREDRKRDTLSVAKNYSHPEV